MAENTGHIQKTTVDQLPETSDVKGFWLFGWKADNPIGKRSVKFSFEKITSLFGVVSEFGQSITHAISQKSFTDEINKKADLVKPDNSKVLYTDKNGKISESALSLASDTNNGLMSSEQVKQLNEILEEMKTNTEKYHTTVVMQLNDGGTMDKYYYYVSKLSSANDITVLHTVDNIEQQFIYRDFSVKGNTVQIALPSYAIGKTIVDYLNNISVLNLTDLPAKSVDITTNQSGITQIQAIRCTMDKFTCNGVESLQRYYASNTNVSVLDFRGCSKLTLIQTAWESKLTTVRCDSKALTSILLSNCTALSDFRFSSVDSNSVSLSTIYLDNTAITKESLLRLMDLAKPRVGSNAGALKINQALYDSLTEDEKQSIVDKNFTIII